MSWTKLDHQLHGADGNGHVTARVLVQVGPGDPIFVASAHGQTYEELLTTIRGAFIECARSVGKMQMS